MASSLRKPLRLWPGIVLAVLLCTLRFGVTRLGPDAMVYGLLGGLACGVAILLWWLFFSRAPWIERLGALVLMALAFVLTKRLVDISIATGAMGMLLPLLSIPVVCLVFVVWAVATRNLSDGIRRATMAAAILLAFGSSALIKTGGFTGSFRQELYWRWAKTPEERLLAKSGREPGALPPPPPLAAVPAKVVAEPAAAPAEPMPPKPVTVAKTEKPLVASAAPEVKEKPAEWPGFRGPHRDDVISGVRIKTDWASSPPVAIWRKPIGPGWSSFAVRGDLIYTQEQRGPDEIVACYRLTNGEPVWAHRDPARFWESNGGPGPRGTPTLSNGRAYTFGATGIVNVLDADSGAVVWSRNAASDTGMKTPQWGFASSPLVEGDQVIVGVAGQLAAYDRRTGAKLWTGPAHGVSYSSPQLFTIDGVPQVLLLSEAGVTSVALADGKLLWDYGWAGYPIVQPAQTPDGQILVSVNMDSGTRSLSVGHGANAWTVQERWTSHGLKPYFNDFVVHKGYAYGFDGSILACIDLQDGKRKWKGGRYGNGQLVLLADEDLLLVTSEEGELALVKATPDQFTELAKVPAIEGKTWNHPVLVGDVLLVRNGQEMAAFRMSPAGI